MAYQQQKGRYPKFGTILINRKSSDRPSELEMGLRHQCQKLRVVEKLAGDAHGLLVVAGSPSVAVRVYSSEDIARLERPTSQSSETSSSSDVDGLRSFRDVFEVSIVFFVLPSGEQQRDQLSRRESFVSLAQKSLLSCNTSSQHENNDQKKKDKIHTARTFIVPDVTQAIETIDSVVQSLKPDKREKKRKFFSQVASDLFFPNPGVSVTQEAIATHVTKQFIEWADRFELPIGDAGVILSVLGSLGNVATADSTTLDEVPVMNETKEMVARFFGSYNEDRHHAEAKNLSIQTNQIQTEGSQFQQQDYQNQYQQQPPQGNVHQDRMDTVFDQRSNPASIGISHLPFQGGIDFTPMQPHSSHGGRSASNMQHSNTQQRNIYGSMSSNSGYLPSSFEHNPVQHHTTPRREMQYSRPPDPRPPSRQSYLHDMNQGAGSLHHGGYANQNSGAGDSHFRQRFR